MMLIAFQFSQDSPTAAWTQLTTTASAYTSTTYVDTFNLAANSNLAFGGLGKESLRLLHLPRGGLQLGHRG